MKSVINIIKIILVIGFIYNTGLIDRLLVSERDYARPVVTTGVNSSAHENLFAMASELQKETDVEEISIALLNTYFKNIPLIFILFLTWFYQDRKRFKNPLSFVVTLIIYPIVIIKLIYDWVKIMDSNIHEFSREFLLKTEFRRTKDKFFSLLSDNEIAIIKKAIVKNLSRKDFQNQLRGKGLNVQHSFIIVLLVAIVFTMLPRTLLMNKNIKLSSTGPPGIEVSINQFLSADEGVEQDFQNFIGTEIVQFVQIVLFILLGFIDYFIYSKPRKYIADIHHIPKKLSLVVR